MADDDNLRTLARHGVERWKVGEFTAHSLALAMHDAESRRLARTASDAGAVAMLKNAATAIRGLASGADCERVLRLMSEEVGRG